MSDDLQCELPNKAEFLTGDAEVSFVCSGLRRRGDGACLVEVSFSVTVRGGGSYVGVLVGDSAVLRALSTVCARAAEWLEAQAR